MPVERPVWGEEKRPELSSDADSYALLQAGLDHINQGFSVFDRHLRLVGWNQKFLELLDFPDWIGHRGTPFETLIRYNAERGEYGPGDAEQQVAERVEQARRFEPHFFERTRPTGEILAIRGDPLPEGGFVTVYTDVTEQRHYERLIREQNEELERRVRERTADLHAAHDQLLDAIAKQKDIAEALAVSESRLQLIIDRVPAGIAYWDKDVQCLFANRPSPATCGSTGWRRRWTPVAPSSCWLAECDHGPSIVHADTREGKVSMTNLPTRVNRTKCRRNSTRSSTNTVAFARMHRPVDRRCSGTGEVRTDYT